MEEYLNSNFASACVKDIIILQDYLNDLGYKNSKGKQLEVTGDFDNDTKDALTQLKKDHTLFKKLQKSEIKIMHPSEYNIYLNGVIKDMYASESFGASESSIQKINNAYKISGQNWNKVILIGNNANLSDLRKNGIQAEEIENGMITTWETYTKRGRHRKLAWPLLVSDDQSLKRMLNFNNVAAPTTPKIPTLIEKENTSTENTLVPIVEEPTNKLLKKFTAFSQNKNPQERKIGWVSLNR